MNTPTLRVIYPARIYSSLFVGAILQDPEQPTRWIEVAQITDRGAWTTSGDFLTIDRINQLVLVRNGGFPNEAA